jgi:hypothetical protein
MKTIPRIILLIIFLKIGSFGNILDYNNQAGFGFGLCSPPVDIINSSKSNVPFNFAIEYEYIFDRPSSFQTELNFTHINDSNALKYNQLQLPLRYKRYFHENKDEDASADYKIGMVLSRILSEDNISKNQNMAGFTTGIGFEGYWWFLPPSVVSFDLDFNVYFHEPQTIVTNVSIEHLWIQAVMRIGFKVPLSIRHHIAQPPSNYQSLPRSNLYP